MATFIEKSSWVEWSGSRDSLTHRTYELKLLIGSTSRLDGPATVMNTPGVPIPGSPWIYGNDFDPWAYCRWDCLVQPHKELSGYWEMSIPFSSKPMECHEFTFEDPLLEPVKVSGSFQKHKEEATEAEEVRVGPQGASAPRLTTQVVNSAWEQLRGPQVEFDANREQVTIEQNVPTLGRETFGPMMNTVNDAPLWGAIARAVKLSNVSWERKYHSYCQIYYTRKLEFDIYERKDPDGNTVSGHDRILMDEGTKVLRGEWDTDSTSGTFKNYLIAEDITDPDTAYLDSDQSLYQRYIDFKGNLARTVLNGLAGPVTTEDPGVIEIIKYPASNFLLLGIPTTL